MDADVEVRTTSGRPLTIKSLKELLEGGEAPPHLDETSVFVWKEVPSNPDKLDGEITIVAKRDTVVLLAACWKYDSDTIELDDSEWLDIDQLLASGWYSYDGWEFPNPLTSDEELCSVVFRPMKAGQQCTLRVRAVCPPYVIMPPSRPAFDLELFEPTPELSEDAVVSRTEERATYLLAERRFDDLDAWINELIDQRATFSSGRYQADAVYRGASKPRLSDDEDDALWNAHLALVEQWTAAKPESAAALIALARAQIARAWAARGNGFAEKVTESGWKVFHAYLEKASTSITAAARISERDPYLYACMIDIGKGLGWSRVVIDAALRKCVAVEPWCPATIQNMAESLLPRWGGGPGELEKFASDAVDMTKATCGEAMYAQIVCIISRYESRVFEAHDFSWDRVKRGFDDLEKRYPGSEVNHHWRCLLACLAGDRPDAQRLFAEFKRWPPSSVWKDQKNFERWEIWASPDYLAGAQSTIFECGSRAYGVAWLDGGRALLVSTSAPSLQIYNLTSGKRTVDLRLPSSCHAVAASRDGKLAAMGALDGTLVLWNHETQQLDLVHDGGAKITGVAFSANGRYLAAASDDGTIALWDRDQPEEKSWTDRESGTNGIAFSPNEPVLATTGDDGEIKLWDVATQKQRASWKGYDEFARRVVFSPDGLSLASTDWVELKLWNLATREPIVVTEDTEDWVRDLDVSADGKQIAIAIGDTNEYAPAKLLMFDVERKAFLKPLEGHKAAISAVRFSPDGQFLATTSYDMSARIWIATKP